MDRRQDVCQPLEGALFIWKWNLDTLSVPKGPHSWSVGQWVPQIWEQLWPQHEGLRSGTREGIKRRDPEHAGLPRRSYSLVLWTDMRESSEKRFQSSMCPGKILTFSPFISNTLSFIRTRSLGDLGKDSHNTHSPGMSNIRRAWGSRAPFLSHSLISTQICTSSALPATLLIGQYLHSTL